MKYVYTYEYQLEPYFSDIDSYGIAHHSKFFIWLENARFSLLQEISQDDTEWCRNIRFPVTYLDCKYIDTIKFGDKCNIKTKMVFDTETVKLKFQFRIYKNNNRLCAKASTEHIMLDNNDQIIHSIDKRIIERMKVYDEI